MRKKHSKPNPDDADLTIDPFSGERILAGAWVDEIRKELKAKEEARQVIQEETQRLLSTGWEDIRAAEKSIGLQPGFLDNLDSLKPEKNASYWNSRLWIRRMPDDDRATALLSPSFIKELRRDTKDAWETIANFMSSSDDWTKLTPSQYFLAFLQKHNPAVWEHCITEDNYLPQLRLVEEERALEPRLQKQGWKTLEEVHAITGWERDKIRRYLTTSWIESNPSMWPLRMECKPRLVRVDAIEKVVTEDRKMQELRDQGWESVPDVDKDTLGKIEILGIDITKLDKEKESAIWQHSFTGEYLLHPNHKEMLTPVEPERERQPRRRAFDGSRQCTPEGRLHLEQGWRPFIEAEQEVGHPIRRQIRTLYRKGSSLLYLDKAIGILIAPELIERWQVEKSQNAGSPPYASDASTITHQGKVAESPNASRKASGHSGRGGVGE